MGVFKMLSDIVKKELKRISGAGNCSFEKEDLLCYSYDATNTLHLPEAVVGKFRYRCA